MNIKDLIKIKVTLNSAAVVAQNNAWAEGGSDVTAWDVCTGCGCADWQDHYNNCPVVSTLENIHKSLKIVDEEIEKFNKVKVVRLLKVDDWQGLYVNGKLVEEGHSICVKDIMKHVFPSVDFDTVWYDDVDPELDRFGNHCPENWEELDLD